MLIVDDDPVTRDVLSSWLSRAEGIEVAGTATDGDEVPSAVTALRPDVVLMDLHMVRMNGASATARLQHRSFAPSVLALTNGDDDRAVLGALRAGAVGFLRKGTPPARLIDAVRRAAAGHSVLSTSITHGLLDAAAAEAAAEHQARSALNRLDEQEHEVLTAFAGGHSDARIAARLRIDVATLRTRLSRILTKLHLQNRAELARLAHVARIADRPRW